MLFKMSDDKKTTVEPTVIIATPQTTNDEAGPNKGRLTKKHVVIAIIALLVTGLIVTGALVGMKIYTDSSLEILKYTLNSKGLSQNVSVDGNSVMYHVKKDGGVEAWIVQDFDKGIQVTKQLFDRTTTCFVTALNRSIAADASSIPEVTPDTTGAPSTSIMYKFLPDPIVDLSFLGQKASSMCQNIPTYHAIPDCHQTQDSALADNSTAMATHRSKRTPGLCGYYNNNANCPCVCGCCVRVCAAYVKCVWTYNPATGAFTCSYYYSGLCAAQYLSDCKYNNVLYAP